MSERPGNMQHNTAPVMLRLSLALWRPPENVCKCNALFSHIGTYLLPPLGFLPVAGFNPRNLITPLSWPGFQGLGYIIISFHHIVCIFWPTVLFLLFCTIVGRQWNRCAFKLLFLFFEGMFRLSSQLPKLLISFWFNSTCLSVLTEWALLLCLHSYLIIHTLMFYMSVCLHLQE